VDTKTLNIATEITIFVFQDGTLAEIMVVIDPDLFTGNKSISETSITDETSCIFTKEVLHFSLLS
jgi:hypothetical protein